MTNFERRQKKIAFKTLIFFSFTILSPLVLVFYYANNEVIYSIIGVELKKNEKWILAKPSIDDSVAIVEEKLPRKDSLPKIVNSKSPIDSTKIVPEKSFSTFIADSSKIRILLLGDSQIGGLKFPLNNYCRANGYTIVACLEWESATCFNYARTEKITELITKYSPNYIIITIGLNELLSKDLKSRKKAVNKIIEKFEGIPYSWIGPANWIEDNGINQVYAESVAKGSFYLSKNLILPRGADGRHPSNKGYQIWADSLTQWLGTNATYKLAFPNPKKRNQSISFEQIYLNALTDNE